MDLLEPRSRFRRTRISIADIEAVSFTSANHCDIAPTLCLNQYSVKELKIRNDVPQEISQPAYRVSDNFRVYRSVSAPKVNAACSRRLCINVLLRKTITLQDSDSEIQQASFF